MTLGERPMRNIATCAGLFVAGLRPAHARAAAGLAAASVGGLAAVGTWQFLRVAARELR